MTLKEIEFFIKIQRKNITIVVGVIKDLFMLLIKG